MKKNLKECEKGKILMKIGIVWHAKYPLDIRIAKEIKSLLKRGHKVVMISRNNKRQTAKENFPGTLIYRFPYFGTSLINTFLSIPLPINIFWFVWVRYLVKRENIKLLIARDLPLAFPTIVVGKLQNIPVIFDMAENYPAALEAWRRQGKYVAKVLEKICVHLANHIIVVAEENAERLRKINVAFAKITIVKNTPEMNFFQDFSTDTGCNDKKKFILLYTGFLECHRGLEICIRAMPLILKENSDIEFLIIGKGKSENSLKKLAEKLKVRTNIIFCGWVNFERIPGIIRRSNVCLIPHLISGHTNTTLPNKLFDYMACGKPIVSSRLKPVERILINENCGIVVKNNSPEEFTNAILCLYDNTKLCRKLGENGRKAFLRKYNWEIDGKTFVDCVEMFCPKK